MTERNFKAKILSYSEITLLCYYVQLLKMKRKYDLKEFKHYDINMHLIDIDANINRYFDYVQPPSLWTNKDFII